MYPCHTPSRYQQLVLNLDDAFSSLPEFVFEQTEDTEKHHIPLSLSGTISLSKTIETPESVLPDQKGGEGWKIMFPLVRSIHRTNIKFLRNPLPTFPIQNHEIKAVRIDLLLTTVVIPPPPTPAIALAATNSFRFLANPHNPHPIPKTVYANSKAAFRPKISESFP